MPSCALRCTTAPRLSSAKVLVGRQSLSTLSRHQLCCLETTVHVFVVSCLVDARLTRVEHFRLQYNNPTAQLVAEDRSCLFQGVIGMSVEELGPSLFPTEGGTTGSQERHASRTPEPTSYSREQVFPFWMPRS